MARRPILSPQDKMLVSLCPDCRSRVAVLYAHGARFLCRRCYELPYSSQRMSYVHRMHRKARKIRKRLGASHSLLEPIWIKPKGMHWATFERLCERERTVNNLGAIATDAWLRRAKLAVRRRSNQHHTS
jgi:zinc-ribbons